LKWCGSGKIKQNMKGLKNISQQVFDKNKSAQQEKTFRMLNLFALCLRMAPALHLGVHLAGYVF